MKKILTFVVIAWCALQLNAQTGYAVTGLNLMPNTATTRCDTAITVSFWAQSAANNAQSTSTLPFIITGTNFVPSQFQFNISWGDGTSYQGNGGVSTTGTSITLNPSPAHTYPGPGTYSVVATVLNFANQTVAVDTVVMTLGSCQIPVYSMVQVDCNNDGVIESSINTPVPLILTGSGQTYSGTTANNYYLFTGIEPGFYSLTVDTAWLNANNYIIGNIQGPAVFTAGMGAQTVVITLNCGGNGGNQTGAMCLNGQVFCDQDGNGIFNQGDIPIINAPVSINYGSGTTIAYTNNQGNYGATYVGVVNGTSIVSINNNWLTQNGYTAINLVDTIFNTLCSNGAAPANYTLPTVSVPAVDEDLGTVIISQAGTTIISNTSTINSLSSTLGTGTGTAGSYSNFTAFGPDTLTAGQTYNLSLTSITTGTSYNNHMRIYIDINRNGTFTDAGECMYFPAVNVLGAHTETGTFTIPATAYGGLTRMRVFCSETLPSATYVNSLNYGEYEDYLVFMSSPNQGGGTASPANASFPINCGQNQNNPNCFSGYVFCDANSNNIMDPNELPIAFAPVVLSTTQGALNGNTVTVYTDSTGLFTYCGQFGLGQYVFASIPGNYLAYLGYTANFNIITLVANQNPGMLPINCGGNGGNTCADLWTTVTPWIGYYQNSLAYVKLSWGNYGPSASGAYTLTFTFPAGVTVNTASINTPGYSIAGNTITWNLANINSGITNMDVITFNVPGGLANGTPHYFTSTINPTGNIQDCNQQNNAGNLLQLVGNSYDPNDKNVVRSSIYQNNVIYNPEEIEVGVDDILTYTIRFQNTGTAPAQNIVVIDTLDAQLDFSTFSMVSSSHQVDVVDLGNGILHFEFNGIWLPDSTTNEPASHGEFTYRIQENIGNTVNSEITNTGYIYFDWNAPIITNTTYNINVASESLISNTLIYSVYPNPANDVIQIKLDGDFQCQFMDISGKIIQRSSHHNLGIMDLSKLTSGVYLINISQNDENNLVKIIKN